jgi:hypothetical protein
MLAVPSPFRTAVECVRERGAWTVVFASMLGRSSDGQGADQAGDPADGWWHIAWHWAEDHGSLLWWLFVVSLASLGLCASLLPVIVLRLPADYFASSRDRQPPPRTAIAWLLWLGKNLLGVLFVLAGIAMLLLPGQGLLTILIGLMLINFPGKRALERRIVGRPSILKLLNGMRARRALPPLIVA